MTVKSLIKIAGGAGLASLITFFATDAIIEPLEGFFMWFMVFAGVYLVSKTLQKIENKQEKA